MCGIHVHLLPGRWAQTAAASATQMQVGLSKTARLQPRQHPRVSLEWCSPGQGTQGLTGELLFPVSER